MSKRFVVACVAMMGVLASSGDVSGSITEIQNADGHLDITDETGPVTDISLGSTVMVLDATNLLHATGGIDTSLGFLRIPAANSCTMSQGYLCLDVNGASSALTSPVLQSRSSSTDRFFPSFVSGDLGTAGTKRLMGIGTGNTDVSPFFLPSDLTLFSGLLQVSHPAALRLPALRTLPA